MVISKCIIMQSNDHELRYSVSYHVDEGITITVSDDDGGNFEKMNIAKDVAEEFFDFTSIIETEDKKSKKK